jgi:hypothetical protein
MRYAVDERHPLQAPCGGVSSEAANRTHQSQTRLAGRVRRRKFPSASLLSKYIMQTIDDPNRASDLRAQAGRDALTRDMDERDRWLSRALATLSDTELHVLQIAAPIIERLANSTVNSNAQSEESLLTDKGDR